MLVTDDNERNWLRNKYRQMVDKLVMSWSDSHRIKEKHDITITMTYRDEDYAKGGVPVFPLTYFMDKWELQLKSTCVKGLV